MGILNPLYDAVSWIIVQFHSFYSLIFDKDSGWAWGLSIVSLVILIRICLIPLFVKQIKSTRNMQALQPKMKAIQERYKNDRQKQSEEMMKLYKETGTNPLSSCLPILAQSPFFFALYHVLSNVAKGNEVGVIHLNLVHSAQKAHIIGAPLAAKFTDGAAKVHVLGATLTDVRLVTIVMILMMSASQFYTQRQLMTKNVDMTVKTPFMQQQKMLMYVFPVIFAVMGINFPVGVLIYWLTTNVWTMGQQMFVIYRNPTPGSLAFQQRQERLRAKGKLVEAPEEVAAKEAVEVARANRTQPKRQPKAKRQTGAAAGGPGAPRAGGSAGSVADGSNDSVSDAKADAPSADQSASGGAKPGGPTSGGAPKGGAPRSGGGGKSSGGAPRAGAPRAGGQKQSGGTPGKQSGGAKAKPGNLSSKKK
ncbi:membrane protein insertase YidC [Actinacidiphila paucisporea]|uniref:Membrane protein insertase YidC n=1 Tax=Actinacidiphila paucisporea TaxID=310782 RepID=A0A1M7CC07_9ACTN|nr:membrane protein insertase YidC [Actinacidiphila paucisporea]SHL64666.1 YidC/Oxa1 family membrane protein insertase [Actinacidiphila paucisporea]